MTAPQLRQEIIEAMKSVGWCDDHAKRLEAVEVEADTVMEAVERHAVVLSVEEMTTAWNAMDYAFEALDSDMSLDDQERAELGQLEELKDRVHQMIENAQQGRTEDGEQD